MAKKVLPNKETMQTTMDSYINNYKKKDEYKHYREQEDCLDKLFEQIYPSNTNITEVLAKVACLNAYYSTNVLALSKMASHISSIENIDTKLRNGDEDLVSFIAHIPSIENRKFYSFATKYCFRYNKQAYPLFDSNVEYVLKAFIKEISLQNKYNATDLRDYKKFKEILNEFRNYYDLNENNYSVRDLDYFMWMFGREKRGKAYASI